ncbi:MAG: hypothetical protein U1F61_15490 [Opitutaceae bacterium]
MALLIGFSLALAVALYANLLGLDRERAFYSTVLTVVGSLYGLFAVMGGSTQALLLESIFIAGFVLLSALGFKFSPWLLVAGLFAHGVFDFFHGHVISNPGVPAWWPDFCMSYDITAAAFLAWLLWRRGSPKQTT